MLDPGAVDLSSNKGEDFSLTAKIATHHASATIAARAFSHGLWRPGQKGGQGKLLFLRRGCVCFDIGWVGVIEGGTPVNDGHLHGVGVKWSQNDNKYVIFVDGRPDSIRRDGLKGRAVQDDPDTTFVIGSAVGHAVRDGVANGD